MSAGYGVCDGCGATLSDREMFHGDLCETCALDPFLVDDEEHEDCRECGTLDWLNARGECARCQREREVLER